VAPRPAPSASPARYTSKVPLTVEETARRLEEAARLRLLIRCSTMELRAMGKAILAEREQKKANDAKSRRPDDAGARRE
jgi:hypothetical protein